MRSGSPGRADLIVGTLAELNANPRAAAAAMDAPLDDCDAKHPNARALFLDDSHMNATGVPRDA